MKNLSILFILLLVLITNIFSQERPVLTISGYVTSEKKESIPFTYIWIKNIKTGTIANFNGFFAIPCHAGDSLIFSAVGFKKAGFVIPYDSKDDVSKDIVLATDTIMLRETKALSWKTYQHFKEAVRELDIHDENLIFAKKNFELVMKEIKMKPYELSANGNFRNQMQAINDRNYYGNAPHNQLLNPFAWAQFFNSLFKGDLNIQN